MSSRKAVRVPSRSSAGAPALLSAICFSVTLLAWATASAQAPEFFFSTVADTDTPVPDGVGSFQELYQPRISDGNTAFVGVPDGVYAQMDGGLRTVADFSTAVPGGSGTFSWFDETSSISGRNIAFRGWTNQGLGIYAEIDGVLVRIADTNTAIPGRTETFGGFTNSADISGDAVAFLGSTGFSTSDLSGIFVMRSDGSGTTIADTTTPIPGGAGNFTGFGGPPVISGSNVAFHAQGSGGQRGVYLSLGGSLQVVADRNTLIPGRTDKFAGFVGFVEIDEATVGFIGEYPGGGRGLFVSKDGTRRRVADTNTPVPGGTGKFTFLGKPSIEGEHVAFLGIDEANHLSLFIEMDGVLSKVIGPGDLLDGRTITAVQQQPELDGGELVFKALFDGGQGVFIASMHRDTDSDGISDDADNCADVANANQSDIDGDGEGDACDLDDDNDMVADAGDNCPFDANADQLDTDGDGAGDACDADLDGDGVIDAADACVPTAIGEVVNSEGCSIADLVPCASPWKNHGSYVSAVARTAEAFVASGLITEAEKDATVSQAAASQCGSKQ